MLFKPICKMYFRFLKTSFPANISVFATYDHAVARHIYRNIIAGNVYATLSLNQRMLLTQSS